LLLKAMLLGNWQPQLSIDIICTLGSKQQTHHSVCGSRMIDGTVDTTSPRGAQQQTRCMLLIDGTDRQTHILPLHRPCHTLCKQCQQKHTLTQVFKWKKQLLIYTAQSSHSFGAENCCKAKTGSLVHHAKISTCKIVQF